MPALAQTGRPDREHTVSLDTAPDAAPSFLEPVRAASAPSETPERKCPTEIPLPHSA